MWHSYTWLSSRVRYKVVTLGHPKSETTQKSCRHSKVVPNMAFPEVIVSKGALTKNKSHGTTMDRVVSNQKQAST